MQAGIKYMVTRQPLLFFRQFVQVQSRHRKVFPVISRQRTTLLYRYCRDHGIRQRESTAFLRPLSFELARHLGHASRNLIAFQRAQKSFRLRFLFGTHACVHFPKIERGSCQTMSRADQFGQPMPPP